LTIGVTSAVWKQEAEYQRDTLLTNIARALGSRAIRSIAFSMLPKAPPRTTPSPAPAPPPSRPLSAESAAHLEQELARIADPEIREKMRRILVKSLSRQPNP
jgi:hypothetical protein